MYPTYQVGIHKRMNFYDVEKLEKRRRKNDFPQNREKCNNFFPTVSEASTM